MPYQILKEKEIKTLSFVISQHLQEGRKAQQYLDMCWKQMDNVSFLLSSPPYLFLFTFRITKFGGQLLKKLTED